jgi:hypothetical protein
MEKTEPERFSSILELRKVKRIRFTEICVEKILRFTVTSLLFPQAEN